MPYSSLSQVKKVIEIILDDKHGPLEVCVCGNGLPKDTHGPLEVHV